MSSLKIVRFKVQLDGGGGMVQETCYARILEWGNLYEQRTVYDWGSNEICLLKHPTGRLMDLCWSHRESPQSHMAKH